MLYNNIKYFFNRKKLHRAFPPRSRVRQKCFGVFRLACYFFSLLFSRLHSTTPTTMKYYLNRKFLTKSFFSLAFDRKFVFFLLFVYGSLHYLMNVTLWRVWCELVDQGMLRWNVDYSFIIYWGIVLESKCFYF